MSAECQRNAIRNQLSRAPLRRRGCAPERCSVFRLVSFRFVSERMSSTLMAFSRGPPCSTGGSSEKTSPTSCAQTRLLSHLWSTRQRRLGARNGARAPRGLATAPGVCRGSPGVPQRVHAKRRPSRTRQKKDRSGRRTDSASNCTSTALKRKRFSHPIPWYLLCGGAPHPPVPITARSQPACKARSGLGTD